MKKNRLRKLGQGFTLVEVLMVAAIIGVLALIAAISVRDYPERARKRAALADLHSLKTAVEAYVVSYGQTPAAAQFSESLTGGTSRLVDRVPEDPFRPGSVYGYDTCASNWYYVIYSVGPNGTGSLAADDDAVTGNDGDDIWVSNCQTNNSGGGG